MASRRGGAAAPSSTMIVEDHPPPPERSSLTTADVAGDIDAAGEASADGDASASGASAADVDEAEEMQPLSIERRYRAERQAAKVRHWKEGPYAAGLVELTWRDELTKRSYGDDDDGGDANGRHKPCCSDACSDEMEPTCCCLQMSGLVCSRIGAGRVGNMVVLKEVSVVEEVEVSSSAGDVEAGETEDEDDDDESTAENGSQRTRRKVRRTRIDCVVGPYWPMLFFVTYPLVLGVSLWTAYAAVPGKPLIFQLAWLCLTSGLIYALFGVSCRDPGILPRRATVPADGTGGAGEWRWNDQAQTYRPRGAVYDADCAVVIEEFDHTCPWTGTGIGKKNMPSFQAFVCLVFVCLIMDILTLTGAFG